MLLCGFGNLIPRSGRHITFNFDAGVVFQGSPNVKLNFKGDACDVSNHCVNAAKDPNFLSNVTAPDGRDSRGRRLAYPKRKFCFDAGASETSNQAPPAAA